MSAEFIKDIGDIYWRLLFNHRPFLIGEINFVVDKFEVQRGDTAVEDLFTTLQTVNSITSNTIPKCSHQFENNLHRLKESLEKTLEACEELSLETDPALHIILEKNRATRKKAWENFVDDMTHKCSRIDLTFEEKAEELNEFYSDLERKLMIHK